MANALKPTARFSGIESRTTSSGKPRYRAKVYDRNTKVHLRGLPWRTTLAQARADGVAARASISSGSGGIRSTDTLRQAMALFLEQIERGEVRERSGNRYKPGVCREYRASYERYVDDGLGAMNVEELGRRDLQRLIEHLCEMGLASSTIKNALMPVRSYFRTAVAREEVSHNPTRALIYPAREAREVIPYPPEKIGQLISALPTDDQAFWATLVYAGLRLGEARALRVENVDLTKMLISVRESWDQVAGAVEPKSSAGRRSVPIVRQLAELLERHIASLDWHSGLIFGATADTPQSSSGITDRAYRTWSAQGIDRCNPHRARHTFASVMIEAISQDGAINVKDLSTFMGHSSISTTFDIYGHLLPGAEMRASEAMGNLLDRLSEQQAAAN